MNDIPKTQEYLYFIRQLDHFHASQGYVGQGHMACAVQFVACDNWMEVLAPCQTMHGDRQG